MYHVWPGVNTWLEPHVLIVTFVVHQLHNEVNSTISWHCHKVRQIVDMSGDGGDDGDDTLYLPRVKF